MTLTSAFSIEALTRAAIPPAWLNPKAGSMPLSVAGPPLIGGWSLIIDKDGTYNIWVDGLAGVSATEFILMQNGEERGCVVRAASRVGEGGDFVLFTRFQAIAGDRLALDTSDEGELESMPRIVAVPLVLIDGL